MLLEWRRKKELSLCLRLCLIMPLLFFLCPTVSSLDDQGSSFFLSFVFELRALFWFVLFSLFCQKFSMVEACFVAQRSYNNKKLPTIESKLLFLALKNH